MGPPVQTPPNAASQGQADPLRPERQAQGFPTTAPSLMASQVTLGCGSSGRRPVPADPWAVRESAISPWAARSHCCWFKPF